VRLGVRYHMTRAPAKCRITEDTTMDTTQLASDNLALLAFDLSVKSEQVEKVLNQNFVESKNLFLWPVLSGCGVAVVGTSLLALFSVPVWLGGPLAAAAGYYACKYLKRYFEGDYTDARIVLNQSLMSHLLDSKDAATLARITATIVSSHFGKEKWAIRFKGLWEQGINDDYHYLAAMFTFAPACWRLSAAKVYELNAAANKAKTYQTGS
jgi:hypothetical protein